MGSRKDTVGVARILMVIGLLILFVAIDNYEVVKADKFLAVNGEAIVLENENEIIVEKNNANKKYELKVNKPERAFGNNIAVGLLEALVGKTFAYELNLGRNHMGYISAECNMNSIYEEIADMYVRDLGLSNDEILSIDINSNLDVKNKIVNIGDVKSKDDIVNSLYMMSKEDKDAIDVEIKVNDIKEEEIPFSTVIIPDETRYSGEKEKVEGTLGKKEIVEEITYLNGERVASNIVKEEIIEEAKNTLIYRGTRNPYNDGIAFLNNPTRGGSLTSGYGERWESFHKGIDLAGNIGDNVYAAMDGEVIYAQYNDGGYGNLVMVKHENDMITYYAHLQEFNVKCGDLISKGDVLGYVGNTGISTGPHLHFELRVNNNPVDPTAYIVY
ncbi:M23 family metallopeptidase [Clostridium sp.]|uniref:M23 family metallopeptidase n=1 Tax=Clostridium sp. TaxID=1506 RepID=UPI003F357C9E